MAYSRTFDLGEITVEEGSEYFNVLSAEALRGASKVYLYGRISWVAGGNGTRVFNTELQSSLGGKLFRTVPIVQRSQNISVAIAIEAEVPGIEDLNLRVFGFQAGAKFDIDLAAVVVY